MNLLETYRIGSISKRASEHLASYRKRKLDLTDEAIGRLVDFVYSQSHYQDKRSLRILDAGCGRGELVNLLDTMGYSALGIDSDEQCVQIANEGKKLASTLDINEIDKQFAIDSFDIAIFSNSLEHCLSPVEVMEKAKGIARFIIVAVPNPARTLCLIANMRRHNYSNPGHMCCWDRSHFTVFLERRCNLRLVKWETDDVRLVPGLFPGLVEGGLRRLGLKLLEGKILTRIFPYFSSSLIALAEVKK